MDLSGRVVIVTGSTSGIGEAVARRLADCGAGVVINSSSSAEAGRALADELPDATYVQGDIGDPTSARRMVEAARARWGRLDGVVNNAGVTAPVPLTDFAGLDVEHWDAVLRTNVVGTFLVTQAALDELRRSDDGWVINITSTAGVRQLGSSLPYSVSKAALHHLTRLLARHLGPEVRVNAVAPGLTETPWIEPYADLRAFVEDQAPLGRVGTTTDVADAVLALVGLRYLTGQVVVVDGGLTLLA
jgi:ketoreductase RED2